MPQTKQLTASLSIWFYPKDHAPPHFHLIGADTDAMIDLRDFQVIAGSYKRKDLSTGKLGESSMTNFDDHDEVVILGERLPRLVSVATMDNFHVAVTWEDGTRAKTREIVDLAPAIMRYKVYAPLRENPELFRTVKLQGHRFGIAWGERGDIDMGASTVADLADETMTAEDFTAFMERHNFTLDRVAAELGISRRMAAYYRKQHKVPRTVALACRYLDSKARDAVNTAGGFGC